MAGEAGEVIDELAEVTPEQWDYLVEAAKRPSRCVVVSFPARPNDDLPAENP